MPARVTPESVEMVNSERDALLAPARAALARPGGVAVIRESKHITDQALCEIAGHLGIDIAASPPRLGRDPLHDMPAAEVDVRVKRADGTEVAGTGVCSAGETILRRGRGETARWSDWHAMCSMAETRARVRALTVLLKPVITLADTAVSATAAETIPPAEAPAAQRRVGAGAVPARVRARAEALEARGHGPAAEAVVEACWGDWELAVDELNDIMERAAAED